jgi:glutamyl-tRNA reductase
MQHKSTFFYAIGLSYKKADAEVRGHFSLSDTAKEDVLKQAKSNGIESLVVISTCNRTELYGFAEHPYQLIHLLCENTKGTVEEFQEVAYVYKAKEAISHMFRVGSGLDSQILGDFEIISQLKSAARQSKKANLLNSFSERLVNAVIQASKRIKNETELSSGATSVSFAAVHYIMNTVEDISDKNILLFGTGKIGRNTCENLVKHTKNSHITLINRTKTKAEEVAGKFNLIVKDFESLEAEVNAADIVIVATGAQNPTVQKALISTDKPLLFLDLSIPKNVNEDVNDLDNVTLVHMDDLAKITDITLEKRKTFIPTAKKSLMRSWENSMDG